MISKATRQRMHLLDRAQSLSADKAYSAEHNAEELSPSSHTDWYESRSDSSMSEEEDEEGPEDEESNEDSEYKGSMKGKERAGEHTRSSVDTARLYSYGARKSPVSPRTHSRATRAWYEFDLAVVVALVSPVGNWLTGGDHIKNLLLVLFLIFYLHQIIEVPWNLYQSARPVHPRSPAKTPYAAQLRTLEIFFFIMTLMSPFLGAILLQYASRTLLGDDSVTWFSVGLFVLATAIRPFTHLAERLSERTEELQALSKPSSDDEGANASSKEVDQLKARVANLEKSLAKLKSRTHGSSEEVYSYIDDALDTLEKSIRKQQRRFDRNESRVLALEDTLALSSKPPSQTRLGSGISTKNAFSALTHSLISRILPAWLISPPQRNLYSGSVYTPAPSSPSSPALGSRSPRKHSHHSQSPPSSSSAFVFPSNSSFGPLETIVEEDVVGSARTIPLQERSELSTPLTRTSNLKVRVQEPLLPSQTLSTLSLVTYPYTLVSSLVTSAGYWVFLPVRVAARMVSGS
ncbi:hypothetical protein BDQ12DRAFT_736437 [Crucibulum laeve]|uniref:Uncharacterized protein n=1 Tax=Crucibulum laeve TaxID=68775 RepID=A0A5C3LY27_9AGAR|nr:hypothetical protein BDQ12DRAFT_736437 [Crucibulum laeve]